MSCDLGDGNPFHVETNLPSKYALCDNRWHNISALYDSEQIVLRIDSQPPITKLAENRMPGKVHTKSPLYIGGIPGKKILLCIKMHLMNISLMTIFLVDLQM